MGEAQPGIFAQGTRSHYHLEFTVRDDAPTSDVRAAISRLGEPSVTVGGFNLVLGVGPTLWDRLEPATPLAGFRDSHRSRERISTTCRRPSMTFGSGCTAPGPTWRWTRPGRSRTV